MTKDEAIAFYRTQAKLAAALGCAQAAVAEWVEIPRLRQFQLECISGGNLQADRSAMPKRSHDYPKDRKQRGQTEAPAHAAPVQATLAPPLDPDVARGLQMAEAAYKKAQRAKADGAAPGPLSVDAEASSPPHIEERHAASSNVVPTIAETPEEQAQIDAALAELDPAEREEMRQRIARAASVRVVSPIEARLAAAAGAATSTSRAAAAPKARRVEPWEMSDRTIMQKAVELRISIPNGATFGHIRQLCLQQLARK